MSDMRARIKEALEEFDMHFFNDRLETFKDWPFQENCECTPEKLAAAGFVYCGTENEPDLVKCYVCLKELDGWEPEDDPWKEHVGHSGACPFLKYENIMGITLKEFCELEKARMMNHCMKGIKHSKAEWSEKRDEIQEKIFGKQKQ
ncbi:hypothetical protein J437_LFUL001180 [Ladona fulva]|uniref:Survivin n=1 Tax=Ladona fulva TaxID=123851 RepID=A0A8K0JV96_LADFU|nr:hypothetical protein J437_LFUL001180 [Ladona fulva]